MKKLKTQFSKKILGMGFIMLGIIGLFLPILQGLLFIFIGLTLLGYSPAKKWLQKLKTKQAKSQQSNTS